MIDIYNWIDVPWYVGQYKMLISENRVLSMNYRRTWKIRDLTSSIDKTWHCSFTFPLKRQSIHQLVMLIKEWPCPEWMVVCHNDWNASNNHPDNLRYDTLKWNTNDMRRHWTMFFINNNPKPSLGKFWWTHCTAKPVLQYTKDWEFIREWWAISEAHRELWLHISNITHCCRWRLWKTWGFIWKYKE